MGKLIQGPWGRKTGTPEASVKFDGETVTCYLDGKYFATLKEAHGGVFFLESYIPQKIAGLGLILKLFDGPRVWIAPQQKPSALLSLIGYIKIQRRKLGNGEWVELWDRPAGLSWAPAEKVAVRL